MILNLVSLFFKLMEGHRMVTDAKKKGLLLYLRFLQGVRLGSLGILSFIFFFQIFFFSIVGLFVSGLYLLPLDIETKIWIVFGVCFAITFIMALVLVHIFSQKTWLKHSGVSDLISK